MPDYKKLYYKSFNTITDMEQILSACAKILREFQRECEEIYIEDEENENN